MTTLHIISKSLANADIQIALRAAQKEDAIILINDAVYAFANKTPIDTKASVFALAPDLIARGLNVDKLPSLVALIDYAGFVELSESHQPIVSWY
ncbi:sulfurtransferase complex subunit TusB [Simiduia curdlanivorans]|uniref:Sulfurtransferase complex subunit TusB n=1 Tax=Simiduia curdlanivorans TaxID=1492769 RepID=A0ABV8V9S7_9GAMM|nr:sulfurtransferase complex subunit TusB [Simiduia curdlanivorans]MDN3639724.1 sulfurtransferase complex subunit TusB [Simiduia curdlanivorans]